MYYLFNLLILNPHRGESKIPKATKMEIFVSTTNESSPLTVVIKNFELDATGVLEPCDRV